MSWEGLPEPRVHSHRQDTVLRGSGGPGAGQAPGTLLERKSAQWRLQRTGGRGQGPVPGLLDLLDVTGRWTPHRTPHTASPWKVPLGPGGRWKLTFCSQPLKGFKTTPSPPLFPPDPRGRQMTTKPQPAVRWGKGCWGQDGGTGK